MLCDSPAMVVLRERVILRQSNACTLSPAGISEGTEAVAVTDAESAITVCSSAATSATLKEGKENPSASREPTPRSA